MLEVHRNESVATNIETPMCAFNLSLILCCYTTQNGLSLSFQWDSQQLYWHGPCGCWHPEELAFSQRFHPFYGSSRAEQLKPSLLDNVFDFASSHLYDHGAMILFHVDGEKIKIEIKGFLKVHHFKVFKEWMDINRLRMMSSRNPQTVSATHISFCSWICSMPLNIAIWSCA
jgi:hypothetical protein